MTIHGEHPFADPEPQRDPVRRLRGRLPAPVTLWAAGQGDARVAATVGSTLVAEPGQLLGLVGADSDLAERLAATGAFTVTVLGAAQRALADEAAGARPAPGGLFRLHAWVDTAHGPRPQAAASWAGCRVQRLTELGWHLLVTAEVAEVTLGAPEPPLVWWRGGYHRLAGPGSAEP